MSALDLPPTTESVPVARGFVRRVLDESGVDVDTAVLLVSEVVTNAVLHARSPFTVVATVVSDRAVARIEVTDGSPVAPRVHAFSSMSATGRGLRMLQRLSLAWGVEPTESGKTIWFEIGQPSDAMWESFDAEDLMAEGSLGEL